MQPARRGRARRSPTPTGSRTPPSLVGVGEKERGERENEKGAAPLVQFGPEGGRGPPFLLASLLYSRMAQ